MIQTPRLVVPALTAVLVVGGIVGISLRGESPLALAPLFPTGLLFVVAGMIASQRRPDGASGRLLTATGLAWLGSQALLTVANDLVATIGLALFPLGLAFLAHLALAYPDGLRSRTERVMVAVPYALVVAGVPVIETGDCAHCARNAVGIATDRGFGRAWYIALLIAAIITALGFLVVLMRRWREGSVAARRVLLPVVPGACLFVLVYVVALLSELGLPTGLGGRWALVALLLIVAAPVVFLAGLLRARLARAHVGNLVVELGDAPPGGGLRDALARALGDPSVEVAYWMPGQAGYVDAAGKPVELPAGAGRRAVTLIERAGRPVGALIHDAALRDDQGRVDAACAAAGLALENERLHAEVLARLEEVRVSRARIVEAGDAARRRVERNLHDGAQQRLVSVSIALGMARAKLARGGGGDVERLLCQASEEAASAISELRELARGLHPSILDEVGLVGALESLAERCPVPVTLSASTNGELPAPIEAAAYYVVAESLTNATKYARASSVHVRVEHERQRLEVEVADDGVGGATVRSGSGLEGLADRVAALDGRLAIHSPPRAGTILRVELPCG
ncbi:MAG: histidine kinase [Actinomycetota bacterium]|nr:histidine kinase [Actinomycetota bacterium]